jgi:hypothetical protein
MMANPSFRTVAVSEMKSSDVEGRVGCPINNPATDFSANQSRHWNCNNWALRQMNKIARKLILQ